MRILHCGDWHVGKLLRGRSRIGEQEDLLQEMLGIALDSQVDVVLVTGDLFDSFAPSPDAERVVYGFFAELVGRGLPAIIIAGNHDHPKRLAALKGLLESLHIHVRSEPRPPDQGGVIELAVGGQQLRVACLPFIPERRVVDACRLMGPEQEWYQEYARRVGQICSRMAEGFNDEAVNLLAAHLHVRGAEVCGSERAVHVAHPYAVDAKDFPQGAAYAALGHLHRPQEVSAPCPARYCGSPLALDFGEQGHGKSVVLVEAMPGEPARVRTIGLKRGRRLQDVAGTLSELQEQAEECGDAYLRVTVRLEEPVPGIAERVRDMLPNALEVRIDYPRIVEPRRSESLTRLAPQEIFAAFHRRQHGAEPPEDMSRLFRLLYQEEVADASD